MTTGEKLFFFILTFSFLLATTVPLEISLVPIINSFDLNKNGSSDFVAIPNSNLPRTLYHIELSSTNTEILWEFTLPKDTKGYFVDVILGDFDKDGTIELIAIANQTEKNNIFYIFSANTTGFHNSPPIVARLQNISPPINNPLKLYPMEGNSNNNQSMFLLSQGSPNRKVIMCEFIDGEVIARGSVGEKFLNNTIGPIDISLGDFNGDNEEDIFILDNGFNPLGYFIYSNGNEKKTDLSNYPRIRLLNEKGLDINFDGTDDLVIISRSGELMSNIWGTESISLSDKDIQNIIISSDNGFIYLTDINQTGKIGNYSIDPLTRSILSTNFEFPKFMETDYINVFSLATSHEIIISHDGDHPEIWFGPLSMELIREAPTSFHSQRIYYQKPDYMINVGEDFFHYIGGDSSISFRNYTEEDIPTGMEFNLKEIKLVWSPKQSQLGFHKLFYTLELMEKGNLEIITEEGKKIISQNEHIIEKNYSYLIYVNDLVAFNNDHDYITIVNGELFKQIILINENNADAQLSVEIISGNNDAIFNLLPSEVILDTLNIISESNKSVASDMVVTESVYLDTVQTEIEKIKDQRIESKIDSLAFHKDSIIFENPEITVDDSLETQSPELLQIAEGITDTLIKPEKVEEVLADTNYMEISYTELITHQAQFSWEPQVELGDYNFTLKVTDGFTADTMVLSLTVHPEIDLSMNKTQLTATVGEFFNTDFMHKQVPPSENYTYNLNNAPENMRIDTTGSISWVPLPIQVNNYYFEIEVTDGIAFAQLQYDIYVNAPPVISSRPPTIFMLPQGRKLSFPLKSFDLNSNTKLEWKLLIGPKEMTLSQQGNLKWSGDELGHHPYKIQLSDGIDSVQWEASIYVNTPPVITSIPTKTIPEGEQYFYPLFAHDENAISPYDSLAANEIIFSLVQGPEGMHIDQNNTLAWETEENPPGEYMVAITASDGVDNAIQIFPVFINSFPEITSTDSVTVSVGDTLKFQITAHDPNPKDTLTFHLDTLYQNLVMGLHSGLLSWAPKKSDIGLHTFNLQVKDGHDDTGTKMQLHIYVYIKPQLTSELLPEAFSDLEYSVFLTAIDMYGNKLRGPKSIIIDTATFNSYDFSKHTHLFKWTPSEEDKGNHEIIIKLTDDSGFTTYHTQKLSVFANPCSHCDKEHEFAPVDTTGN